MKLTPLALALCLAGCAAISPPATTQAALTKSFIAAETAFDAAEVVATGLINSGSLPPAAVHQIKVTDDLGHSVLLAGRQAVIAADATSLNTQITALTSLTQQLGLLTKAH